jgi:hypothetical protein
MLSTELEYLCTWLECLRQRWNTFVQGWNAFYRVGMLSIGLECFRQCWNTLVQGWNAFYRVGMLSTEVEYLCAGLECFL